MGAGQSAGGDGQATRDVHSQRSYYALLDLPRQATDEEVKKAYRRKALELHPDKNPDNVEESTRLFAEIQAAYSVLSDPQERAWYDSHESQILNAAAFDGEGKGGDTGSGLGGGLTTANDLLQLIRKVGGSGTDYSDSSTGFFGYLRDTFARLATEEELLATSDAGPQTEYPSFGRKNDPFEGSVKRFYQVWGAFSTSKDFGWKDKHRYPGAPDRRYRRLMEKENRRIREDAIREFNDAVRSLVAFVKKRDPRYVADSRTEAERQQALRHAAAAQAARSRAANQARLKQSLANQETVLPSWAASRNDDTDTHGGNTIEGAVGEDASAEEAEESDNEEEEEEEEEELFECVACAKDFKSENQFKAHEQSKKHQKQLYQLKRKMEKENKLLRLDDEIVDGVKSDESEADTADRLEEQPSVVDGPDPAYAAIVRTTGAVSLGEADLQKSGDETSSETESEQSNPEADGLKVDKRQKQSDRDSLTMAPMSVPKVGKAAQKRARRAAKEQDDSLDGTSTPTASADVKLICVTCNAAFLSRTRLFQHIKDLGHASLLPREKKTKMKTKGRSKR